MYYKIECLFVAYGGKNVQDIESQNLNMFYSPTLMEGDFELEYLVKCFHQMKQKILHFVVHLERISKEFKLIY